MTETPSCLMRQVLGVLRSQYSVFLRCDVPMRLYSNYNGRKHKRNKKINYLMENKELCDVTTTTTTTT